MDVIIRAIVVYAFLWLVIRALGKRELAELTVFELVLLFVVGDLVQQSVTQNDTSISAAILAVSTIALLILVQSYIAFRFKRARRLIEGMPIVVVRDGDVFEEALHLERMTRDELLEEARKSGIDDLASVRFGILEADGKMSFVADDSGNRHRDSEHRSAL